MARYGITLGYEKDKCSICGYEKEIRVIYDTEDLKLAKVCDACLNDHGNESVEQIVGKYGEKTDIKNINILTGEELMKKGFELTGIKEPKKPKTGKKTKKKSKKGDSDGKNNAEISG